MMSVLLNTNILSINFGDSPLEIGLWNIPFSLGTMLGSILGGYVIISPFLLLYFLSLSSSG